jgi:MFS family permease
MPDGEVKDTPIINSDLAQPQTVEVDFTLKKAVKNSTFWHIALAFMCHLMMVSAITTHVMPYLSSIGIARVTSSLVAAAVPLISVSGRLGLGWLGDRLDRRRIAAGAFAMMSLGALCFGYTSTIGTPLLVPFLILFGIGYGGGFALKPSLTREYFGRTKFGSIFGLIEGVSIMGGISGPPLAGWVYDNQGSYQIIWFVFAGLAVAGLVSVFTISSAKTSVKLVNKT